MPRLLLPLVSLLLLGVPVYVQGEPVRIILLGDSITKGVRPGVTPQQTFSALVEQRLRQQGIHVEVTNAGVGGETTVGAGHRLNEVLAKQPHLVALMYGTNDCHVDKGQAESRVALQDFEANLSTLLQRLHKAGIQTVLMTEPAYAEDGPPNGLGEDSNIRLGQYMKVCRALARAHGVPLVDHFAHWSAQREKGIKLQPWTTDGYHPSPRGHEEIAHRLVQVILPLTQRLADRLGAWDEKSPYRLQLDVLSRGYDGEKCWVHPRAGVVPGTEPAVVLTMQKLLLSGSDVFDALNDLRSDDLGATWSTIRPHAETLGRRQEPNNVVVAACDFTPKWHAPTRKLLGIGQTVRYLDNKVMEKRQRETCYSVYDDAMRTWSAWRTLAMPELPKFYAAGAGSAQRVDLANGDILLPVYFKGKEDPYYRVTVVRCSFDGTTLKYLEHGNELELSSGRGLFEPSLTRFGNKFYLTMRNEAAGFVSVSDDGLHFSPPKRWDGDDGTELGNYNTQQHWVSRPEALYLVYTRKGDHNDHVFRHRAPLFMAQVDPDKLQVLRQTERIVVPELGARLGNFGVVDVGEHETWITVAEWMQTWGPQQVIRPDNIYQADNRVYAARLRWARPNPLWTEPPLRLPREDLLVYRGPDGQPAPVRSLADWERRRAEMMRGMEFVMGKLPGAEKRCPLDVKIEEEVDGGTFVRRLITYASEPGGRLPAYLLIPKAVLAGKSKAPAVLCLHGTNNVIGHGVAVGLGELPNRAYALELAERGYVTLAPNYPLLAKYQPDLQKLGWQSGTLKAVWDNIRGLDLLESLPFVDHSRGFGTIGHSLGGHNSVYTAVFEPRLTAVVTCCGVDAYVDYFRGNPKFWDFGKGWCQTRYIPRLAGYKERLADIPFDFSEMVGALAPRHVLIVAPLKDSNFRADSVDRIVAAARPVFKLYGHEDRLRVEHPDCGHDFPDAMREEAYKLFDAVLAGKR
jgi:lysophospholipase L1-like esterase